MSLMTTHSFQCIADEQLKPLEHGDRFAYWLVLKSTNLVVDTQTTVRKAVSHDLFTEIAYNLTATSELALITLDRSTSKEAYRGLAYLSLIELDGSVSEAQTCAVLGKGKSMLPYLEDARRARVAGRCVIKEEFEVSMKPGLCRSVDEAKQILDAFIRRIKESEQC